VTGFGSILAFVCTLATHNKGGSNAGRVLGGVSLIHIAAGCPGFQASGGLLAGARSAHLGLHKTSDLRVSIAPLADAVASGSPSRTRLTISGDSQARWIRLLT
jgi:hypothetical protein